MYKEKEMKYLDTINNQKQRIDEYTLKIEQLEKELQFKSMEMSKKE
jgi:transcription initiation factor IIF auxiliary subunit